MQEKQEMEVNEVFISFLESKHRYAVLLGGAGSGKSIATIQKLILRITTEKNHRILCVRKVARTLRQSIYQGIIDLITAYGISHEFEINISEMRFTHKLTGNEIILAGLDDSEKIKSIAGITSVWCEEATELTEMDFNQLELRVRGETINYKQFILTFNPIDEDHWLKKRFFDIQDEQVFTLKTTFLQNAFLDKDYKKHLLERVKINENLYKIYVLGEWGRVTYGGEFYKCFLMSKHVGKTEYNPDLPIHLTFDFNVNPYMSASVWQIKEKKSMKIDEICLSHPRNTSMAVCAEFERMYMAHKAGLFIYGDPGGLKQSTADETFVRVHEKDYSDFGKIFIQLSKYNPVNRVTRAYPPVKLRGDFINTIFQSEFEGIKIIFGENCKKTHAEYSNLKEASDGTKHKEKYKDEITGVQCEKYGHISDHDEYFLTMAFANEFAKYQNGGKSIAESFSHGKIVHGTRNRY
jgi:hypothetical protein